MDCSLPLHLARVHYSSTTFTCSPQVSKNNPISFMNSILFPSLLFRCESMSCEKNVESGGERGRERKSKMFDTVFVPAAASDLTTVSWLLRWETLEPRGRILIVNENSCWVLMTHVLQTGFIPWLIHKWYLEYRFGYTLYFLRFAKRDLFSFRLYLMFFFSQQSKGAYNFPETWILAELEKSTKSLADWGT